MAKRVLMVLTSHDVMGISGKKTGSWFDEVATPYYTFMQRGFDVVLASPRGGAAPTDPASAHKPFSTPNTERFEKDPTAQRALANTLKLTDVNHHEFDGVFFPGGYGPLWDLASNSLAIKIIEDTVEQDKPVAFVCHAPASLRDAKKPNGEPLVKGRKVTGFTDVEDDELDLSRHLLFSVEQMLKANGGNFIRSEKNWEPNVVEDGALITGQNPASAGPIAEVFANRLG
ncbi:MAG TPA: type 1 glutamine amidotransferase domain-containing protein [Gemmatimonadaceae bacterium]|nr:type 1 glutamine amidotransferase domain-containing protein [Gemmatimonadaceae bacterium]